MKMAQNRGENILIRTIVLNFCPQVLRMCSVLCVVGRKPYLLFANHHDVSEIRLDSGDDHIVVASADKAIAVDFDYESNYVCWSDVAQGSILRARYNHFHLVDASQTEIIVTDLVTPDSIAVDWLHKLIYWTDSDRNTIEVIDLRAADRHRLTLFNTELDEPHSIRLDPRGNQGWIYWTSWGRNPKIERSGMDGNHKQAIVTSGLQSPNGMTIDYVSNKLFWVDAEMHRIMNSNLDGSQPSIILTDDHYLSHAVSISAFSISVFEDTLYWTDWLTGSIRKTNKFKGTAVSTVVDSLSAPWIFTCSMSWNNLRTLVGVKTITVAVHICVCLHLWSMHPQPATPVPAPMTGYSKLMVVHVKLLRQLPRQPVKTTMLKLRKLPAKTLMLLLPRLPANMVKL